MSELKQKEGRNISVHLLNFCEENHEGQTKWRYFRIDN